MAERICRLCPRKHHAKGLCRAHYRRMRHGLDLDAPVRQWERHGKCKFSGCENPRKPAGSGTSYADYCPMHRMRLERKGDLGPAVSTRQPATRTAGLPRLKRAPNGSPRWNQPEYQREYKLMLEYGITQAELGQMITSQENQCAICGNELVPDSVDYREQRTFAIDHDHGTGEVRGLLCGGCNTGIGFLRHDPVLLAGAIGYLSGVGQCAKSVGSRDIRA